MPDEIYLEGGAEFDAALARLLELITDLRPFWPLVVPLFIGWIGKQFESEGEFFGTHWAPLTWPYEDWKMEHYPNKGILSAEGDLRRAATSPKREPLPQSLVLRIIGYEKTVRADPAGSRARAEIGKTMDPDWFQSGTNRMVARPLLAETLPPEAQSQLSAVADQYIQENAVRLGLLSG